MDIFNEAIPPILQVYLGKPDPRTSKWYLLTTPTAFLSILLIYFGIIIFLKNIMKNRPAFDLRKVLIVYNFSQVLYSAYICKEVFMSAYLAKYKLTCTPVDTVTNLGFRMARAFWLFYLSKVFDLSDTIFFVLRKKQRQITFLHLYHHSTMIFNWYIGVLYSPGGQAFISVLFNSFVHVIMYTYYMLTAVGPKMQKYLWWKRYLTQIQLIQFLVIIAHLIIGLYNKCEAPFWLNWFTIIYMISLVVLFSNFYYNAYRQKKTVKKTRRKNKKVDLRAAGDFKHE